jgi:hypothetical protein
VETAGPALPLAISPSSVEAGKREVRGEVFGMATSLRLCKAAGPLVVEASRSAISTGRSTDGAELDRGSRGVFLGPVVVNGTDVAIGRGDIAGADPDYRECRARTDWTAAILVVNAGNEGRDATQQTGRERTAVSQTASARAQGLA